jgi:hypothetical protein
LLAVGESISKTKQVISEKRVTKMAHRDQNSQHPFCGMRERWQYLCTAAEKQRHQSKKVKKKRKGKTKIKYHCQTAVRRPTSAIEK